MMKTDKLTAQKPQYDNLTATYGRPDRLQVEFDHREIYGHVMAANDLYIGLNSTSLDTALAKGQSFQVPEDCMLSAIQLHIDTGSVAQELVVRVGESSDLSAYLAEYRANVIDEAGQWATILTDRALQLARGTTYYFGVIKTTADPYKINLNFLSIYADGSYCGGGTDWAMTPVSSWDLNFRVYGDLV